MELRRSNSDVATVTSINLSVSLIPFNRSTNDHIVEELAMQKDILEAKLSALQ